MEGTGRATSETEGLSSMRRSASEAPGEISFGWEGEGTNKRNEKNGENEEGVGDGNLLSWDRNRNNEEEGEDAGEMVNLLGEVIEGGGGNGEFRSSPRPDEAFVVVTLDDGMVVMGDAGTYIFTRGDRHGDGDEDGDGDGGGDEYDDRETSASNGQWTELGTGGTAGMEGDDETPRRAVLPSSFCGKTANLWASLWHMNPFTLYMLLFMIVFVITSLAADTNGCALTVRLWLVGQTVIHILQLAEVLLVRYEIPQRIIEKRGRRSTAARLMFWSMRILMLAWILWLGVGIILRTRAFQVFIPLPECWTKATLVSICITSVLVGNVLFTGMLIFFGAIYLSCYYAFCPGRMLEFLVNYVPAYKGAPDAVIEDSTKRKKFASGMIAPADALCAVCLIEYEAGDELRFLPCKHHFHKACIDPWLHKNKTCATCRQDIDPSPHPSPEMKESEV